MNKLLSTIKWDMRFQLNNGLYLAGVVLSGVYIVIISLFPAESMQYVLPIVLLSDLSTMGMMFIAAILFFERGQGSIHAVVVTPLTTKQYLQSKVISLTIYVVAVSSTVVIVVSLLKHMPLNYLLMLLAITTIAVAYILGGFVLSTYYKNFTDFIFPLGLIFALSNLPLLWLFEIEALAPLKGLIYLIPSQGMVILLQAIFTAKPWYDLLYAIGYNSLVILLLYRAAIIKFNRKIIGRSSDIDG